MPDFAAMLDHHIRGVIFSGCQGMMRKLSPSTLLGLPLLWCQSSVGPIEDLEHIINPSFEDAIVCDDLDGTSAPPRPEHSLDPDDIPSD